MLNQAINPIIIIHVKMNKHQSPKHKIQSTFIMSEFDFKILVNI